MKSEPEGAAEARASRILVVEDEVLIRTMIAELLRDEGFSVVEAANADEAWEFLQAGGHVDLIFSDIDMPGQMDGIALGERVKARYPFLPVILTSGGACGGGPMTPGTFLPKPFQLNQVLGAVASLLHGDEKGKTV